MRCRTVGSSIRLIRDRWAVLSVRGPPIHSSRPVSGKHRSTGDPRDPCYRGAALSDPTPESSRLAPSPGSPAVAGFLSFLFPGLGQLYVRRRRAAAVFAIPVLVLIVVVALQSLGGIQYFAAQLIDPTFALAALIVFGSLGLWRLASIGHAAIIAEPPGRRLRPQVVAVVLILGLAVVIPHGVAWYYAWSFYDAGTQIFRGRASSCGRHLDRFRARVRPRSASPSPSDNADLRRRRRPPCRHRRRSASPSS